MKTISNKKWSIIGLGMMSLSSTLLFLSYRISFFADWYSTHIYPIWVSTLGRFMGWLPFPVFELLLYLGIMFVLYRIIRSIIRIVRKDQVLRMILHGSIRVWVFFNMMLLLFIVNCGINYQRSSFADTYGYGRERYSIQELKKVAIRLTEEVNLRADGVSRDHNGIMFFDSKQRVKTVEAIQHLSIVYPSLSGYYPTPKTVLVPEVLSYQQVAGVFVPFTIEAYVNGAMVGYTIPFTMVHELAHVRGYMSEDEANFIGFLACTQSGDIELEYSGYLNAWVYVWNELHRYNIEEARAIRDLLHPSAVLDLQANREFWARYDGPISELQDRVNDGFLHVQGVEGGILSYNKVVDLIVSYYDMKK